MVYDSDVTKAHPLAENFSSNFNDMIKADGGMGIFPNDTVAISLDAVERSKRRQEPKKTMDSALGVVSKENPGRKRNKRMLLCEFRFNSNNWRYIKTNELEEKIDHSKSLLMENYEGQIEPKCFFIFNKNIYQQVKNLFGRLYHGKKDIRIVVTEEEFKDFIF